MWKVALEPVEETKWEASGLTSPRRSLEGADDRGWHAEGVRLGWLWAGLWHCPCSQECPRGLGCTGVPLCWRVLRKERSAGPLEGAQAGGEGRPMA